MGMFYLFNITMCGAKNIQIHAIRVQYTRTVIYIYIYIYIYSLTQLYLDFHVHLDVCVQQTNLVHQLPSVYPVPIAVHISGLLVVHHQEVTKYICNNWYVLYVLVDFRLVWLEWN
jgi:hypothetical protein